MATCWASVMHVGQAGYRNNCREIVQTRQRIEKGYVLSSGLSTMHNHDTFSNMPEILSLSLQLLKSEKISVLFPCSFHLFFLFFLFCTKFCLAVRFFRPCICLLMLCSYFLNVISNYVKENLLGQKYIEGSLMSKTCSIA